MDSPTALHLGQRLGLGVAPGQLAEIESLSFDGFLSSQLYPQLSRLPRSLNVALEKVVCFDDPYKLYQRFWWTAQLPNPSAASPELRKHLIARQLEVLHDARTARLASAIASPWQLHEALVEFWFNHFNVFCRKGEVAIWVGAYEAQAIRPHTLGRFSDMLLATAKHPAMLVYLDNAQNHFSRRGTKRDFAESLSLIRNRRETVGSVNENFAREAMELHTLGVNGGYTQGDVISLAHILTGWTVGAGGRRNSSAAAGLWKAMRGVSRFVARRHDSSPHTLLGKQFQGDGPEEGDAALLMLARHPATAHHISFKLAQFFVSDRPSNDLVNSMAIVFLQTDGEIRHVIRTMANSEEFRASNNFRTKFKTPYRYVVSVARALGIQATYAGNFASPLNELGQQLYGCSSPDGYACTEVAWLNPAAVLERITFARRAASGALSKPRNGAAIAPVDPSTLIDRIGSPLSATTISAAALAPPALRTAALLASPEFMRC